MKQILLFIVLFPFLIFGQTQLGSDIDGEANGDQSGTSVSISSNGLTIAIGARLAGTSNEGHVRIFSFDNATNDWLQLGSDIDGETGDQSGTSVSISSDGLTIAIGAPLVNSSSGHVRVYQFDNNTNDWIQRGSDIDGENFNDLSGSSVSISNDGLTVAIGAPHNEGMGFRAGHVRVYSFDNTTNDWIQLGLDIDGEADDNFSGIAVSLSSDGLILAIGAPQNDNANGSNAGHVRVYEFDAVADDWIQLGLDIDGEGISYNFGTSVSLSDDGLTVTASAPRNDGISGSDVGRTRIFRFDNTTNNWVQVGSGIDGESNSDRSGDSIDLSSDGLTVAIGARSNVGGASPGAGHVRVFRFDTTTNDWAQLGIDMDGDVVTGLFGSSVSLSSDGLTVIAGAPTNGSGNDDYTRIYDLSATLSTENFVLANFIIYPNPTSTFLTIELKNGLILEKVTIYNTIGQLVHTVESNTINVRKLNTGMYYVQVFTDKGIGTKQIIVD